MNSLVLSTLVFFSSVITVFGGTSEKQEIFILVKNVGYVSLNVYLFYLLP
jgi:hypothetical protein